MQKRNKPHPQTTMSQTRQKMPPTIVQNQKHQNTTHIKKTPFIDTPKKKFIVSKAEKSPSPEKGKKRMTESVSRKEIEVFELYRREFLEKLRAPLVTRKKKTAEEVRQAFLESVNKERDEAQKKGNTGKEQVLKDYAERQELKKSLMQYDPQVSYRDKLLFPKKHWNERYKQFQKEYIKQKFFEKQRGEICMKP